MDTLINAIDALLPQTQCEKCGHPGCLPYARAIAAGEAHNKCPPGRQETADALARLLQRPSLPLDAKPEDTLRRVAFIREDECIGCFKCVQACPVDAIVGAPLLMHTVITAECTGCDLCLPPCPVDCIDMQVLADQRPDPQAADRARQRHDARGRRRAAAPERTRATGPAADITDNRPPADLNKLKAAAASAQRRHREAVQALQRAQRAGTGDPAGMQARVDALAAQAAEAAATLAAYAGTNNNTREQE